MLFPPDKPAPATPPRVVVTGAGITTPHGVGWKPNAEGFRAGRTAFRPVTVFDVSRQRVRTAAEIALPATLPVGRLTPRQAVRLDRAGAMLLLAGNEAWSQSGWEAAEHLPLILGTTAGGMVLGEAYFHSAVEAPHRHRQQPTRALQYQAHTQGRVLADALGIGGPITIVTNACTSGADAIGHAWRLLRRGQAERVLAGGYDALCQMVFSGFDSLQALSLTTCRPFDANRDGLALGEGAAILALETLESARRRGAAILAELAGYGTIMDPFHLTQPHPEGDGALAAMTLACQSARLNVSDIGYINAHGTGTRLNDGAEAAAINRWAGPRAASLPVSSTKAGIGHLMGAAGAVEAVVCLMCLREQWLPPELALETPDPICQFPIVRQPQEARLTAVLSNSFGFGGINASLILRRWA
jgi:3-oxoacyl-[acyl-carrier-protein] synthase II